MTTKNNPITRFDFRMERDLLTEVSAAAYGAEQAKNRSVSCDLSRRSRQRREKLIKIQNISFQSSATRLYLLRLRKSSARIPSMNPLKPMKSTALTTILAVGVLSLTLALQQASAVTAYNPNGIYGAGTVLTIGPSDIFDISGYAKTVGNVSMQDTVANAAVITAGNAAVALAARNGIIWIAGGANEAAKDAAQLANIAYTYAKLTTGFAGGAWNGFGINSGVVAADANVNGALAVILYDNTQFGYTQWSGFALADPNARQVLLRVSYAGDGNGDGVVTPDDYLVQNGYLANSQLAQGDLNFDGVLSPDDYLVINGGLANTNIYGNLGNNQTFAGFASPAQAPEPASGLLMAIGAACFAGLRKRKQTN